MRSLCACLAVLSLVSMTAGGEDKDAQRLDGTWLPTSAELGGKKFPDQVLKAMRLTVKDNEYTVHIEGEMDDKGTVKVDPAQTPRSMDITGTDGPNKGKTIPAIYELKEDRLTICYNLGGKTRPTEFKSPAGTKMFLVTYERSK